MPNIHQEVIIGASVEKVYHGLTTSEGLSSWWTPQATAQAEIGTVARFGFGPTYVKEMRIVNLKPLEYVEWSCISGADEWIGTTLKFTLSSASKQMLAQSFRKPEINCDSNSMINAQYFNCNTMGGESTPRCLGNAATHGHNF